MYFLHLCHPQEAFLGKNREKNGKNRHFWSFLLLEYMSEKIFDVEKTAKYFSITSQKNLHL